MSTRNLEHLFRPTSVAVIGVPIRPHSLGATVMKNRLPGGCDEPIMPVNSKYGGVYGVLVYPNVPELPRAPELAVVCASPSRLPGLISEVGERGAKTAVRNTRAARHMIGRETIQRLTISAN